MKTKSAIVISAGISGSTAATWYWSSHDHGLRLPSIRANQGRNFINALVAGNIDVILSANTKKLMGYTGEYDSTYPGKRT
jgi:hypothetical protein